MKYEKYLPIGSVVLLKGGTKRLMITGFYIATDEKKDVIYDYCGCIYPEGMISSDKNCVFNHDQIEKIYCIGYSDDEDKNYREELHKYANQ